jgi:transcriptional regulator with XRE-family HTH domain
MKNEILTQFGKRVKELRIQNKLTQEQLAQKTGLHKNYIGMVERGERNPSLINIQIIANGLEVTISEFFIVN